MTTKLQKLSEAMTRLAAAVDTEENHDDSDPRAWQERVVAVARELDALEPDIAKLRSKAAELDPAKRTYGPAMVAKVWSWLPSIPLSAFRNTLTSEHNLRV